MEQQNQQVKPLDETIPIITLTGKAMNKIKGVTLSNPNYEGKLFPQMHSILRLLSEFQ